MNVPRASCPTTSDKGGIPWVPMMVVRCTVINSHRLVIPLSTGEMPVSSEIESVSDPSFGYRTIVSVIRGSMYDRRS